MPLFKTQLFFIVQVPSVSSAASGASRPVLIKTLPTSNPKVQGSKASTSLQPLSSVNTSNVAKTAGLQPLISVNTSAVSQPSGLKPLVSVNTSKTAKTTGSSGIFYAPFQCGCDKVPER